METRKKILFVSHEIKVNGSSISLLSLIKGMEAVDKNIEVTVLLPLKFGKSGQAQKLFKENKINTKQLLYRENYKIAGNRNWGRKLIYIVYDIWNFFAVHLLRKYIRKEGFDKVCSNSSAVDVGARAACLTNIPHIYYIREFMEEDHGIEYRNKKRMKKLLEDSDYVIFISKSIEKKYKSLYQLKKTIQFYNGFIIEDYIINNHSILNRERIDLIQIGKFADGKGTLDAIRKLLAVIEKGIFNVHLEFVGYGEKSYQYKMFELIDKYDLKEYITISPYTANVKKKLANADILLINSCSEGFGRVTVEGMLAGCLAMGKANAGTAEIVEHEVNGLLYSSTKEFCDNISKILNDRERYREIARIGQKGAMKEFDCSKTAQKFVEFVLCNV